MVFRRLSYGFPMALGDKTGTSPWFKRRKIRSHLRLRDDGHGPGRGGCQHGRRQRRALEIGWEFTSFLLVYIAMICCDHISLCKYTMYIYIYVYYCFVYQCYNILQLIYYRDSYIGLSFILPNFRFDNPTDI